MKKINDLWLNIYTFILIPFCVIVNCYNLFNYIRYFNSINNMLVSVILIILCVISIVFYTYTFIFAKDRLLKSYNLIIASIGLSIITSSFSQTVDTYLYSNMFILMFLLYIVLFTCCWGVPNYIYFSKRKDLFKLEKNVSKEEIIKQIKSNPKYIAKEKELKEKQKSMKKNTKKTTKK